MNSPAPSLLGRADPRTTVKSDGRAPVLLVLTKGATFVAQHDGRNAFKFIIGEPLSVPAVVADRLLADHPSSFAVV